MANNGASLETTIGGKVVGVLAAILVLSGLALLGASFIPQLPDVAKAALIFLFSLVFTAGGVFLVKKSRNAFTYALFACGLAGFFVAIWVSWMQFALFSHIVALSLTGVWMAATIVLLLYTHTWPITIALTVFAGLFGVPLLEGRISVLDMYSSVEGFFMATFFLLVLYAISLCVVGTKLALGSYMADGSNTQAVRAQCLANIFVSEGALFFISLNSAWHYSEEVLVVLVAIVLLVLARVPLPTPLHKSQGAWRANEIVIFCLVAMGISFVGIAGGIPALSTVVAFGVFTVASIVLAGLRAQDRIAPNYVHPDSIIPVLFALTLTGVVVNYICTIALTNVSPYIWSALTIVCALVAIGAGFWFAEKPLRLCGLIMALACILKIALFDLAGDALTHALALVVAGLVCFGISALYTYANKRLA